MFGISRADGGGAIPEPKTLAFDLPGGVWLYSFLRRCLSFADSQQS